MTAYEPASPDSSQADADREQDPADRVTWLPVRDEHADDAERHEGAERASEVGEIELVCEVRQRDSRHDDDEPQASEHERGRG